MIETNVFRNELDGLLKRRKIKKSQRNSLIAYAISNIPENEWNEFLDDELALTNEYESKKKEEKTIPTEFEEHVRFVEWFKKTYPDIKIMLIRNHGTRTPGEKTQQILEGLLPGAADLYVPKWHLWIEVKRSKGGLLSEQQDDFCDYVVNECMDSYIVIQGCDDGIKQIENRNTV